ncbi:MAG: class I SAM-dependent methyltransferase [Patescibacteria group bacterium]|jgi:SAM-dependent methyltransferase
MSKSINFLNKYYGKSGDYLKDHDLFLRCANIKKDLFFLIKSLDFKKNEAILDIACGQGRHVNALREKGYKADGVDFSRYLINKAKAGIKKDKINQPIYFVADIQKLRLPKKYAKAYWFFSDLGNIDLAKTVLSIADNIKAGGKVLFDTDNIFRLIGYLQKNNSTHYHFDFKKLELVDKKNNIRVKYPIFLLWERWFKAAGFSIERVMGNYDFSEYSIKSPRLILVAKKTARASTKKLGG